MIEKKKEREVKITTLYAIYILYLFNYMHFGREFNILNKSSTRLNEFVMSISSLNEIRTDRYMEQLFTE